MKKIYLLGPMDFEDKESSISWRKKVIEFFDYQIKDNNIKILDPWRRPHSNGLSDHEVVELDYKDVENSDLILADIRWGRRENTGSAMEMCYAYRILRKPVIGWYDDDPPRKRLFINTHCTRQFKGLELALEHIEQYYLETE